MISKITSKHQITIPLKIRQLLKLNISDSLEWIVEKGRIEVRPTTNTFLKHKGAIKVARGDIKKDINQARKAMAEKYK